MQDADQEVCERFQEEKFELNCPTDFVFVSEKVTIKEGFGRPLGYSGAPFVE